MHSDCVHVHSFWLLRRVCGYIILRMMVLNYQVASTGHGINLTMQIFFILYTSSMAYPI